MARMLALLSLIMLAGAATLLLRPDQPSAAIELDSGVVVDPPRALQRFELSDHLKQPFSRDRFKGRWTLVMIGFTHCPDICPTGLSQLAILRQRLLESDAELEVLFVSVDPERDTSDVLANYIGFFGDDLTAVSGEQEQLQRLADSLEFAWVKVPLGQDRYTVDHSGALALINPQARLVGYFLPPLELDAIEADLGRILGMSR